MTSLKGLLTILLLTYLEITFLGVIFLGLTWPIWVWFVI